MKKIIIGILVVLALIALVGMYKFNYLANKDNYDVDGNKMIPVEPNNGIGDGDHGDFKKYLEEKENMDSIFKDIPVLETKEIEMEISRSTKDCVGLIPQKCLQIKKKGGEWELSYNKILGFNYVEGDYYVLKIEEKKYDTSKSKLPQNTPGHTWELKEILKHIPREKKEETKEENKQVRTELLMKILIPKLIWSNSKKDHIIEFSEYEVPKSSQILKATYKKLFELRGSDNNEAWNGLKFDSVSINSEKMAIVKLKGSWYPAGDMSSLFFVKEIEAVAFQFPSVIGIKVLVEGKTFDWCVDDMSDGEGGCPETKRLWIENK